MTGMPSTKYFTIALIADIHGNFDALNAVLADLADHHYDQLVIAGDLVSHGPQPAETLSRIRELNVPTIFGNGECDVIEANPNKHSAYWVRQQIGENGTMYLASLPFSHRITPPHGNSPDTDLLIVHATPTSVTDFLILEPQPLGTVYTSTTPEHIAKEMLGDARANLIVYGHIHYASSGIVGSQRLTSIGAVGFPFDGNPQAAYALATWDGIQWHVKHHRVSYDYLRVIESLHQSGQPNPEKSIKRLQTANWCHGHQFIFYRSLMFRQQA
jgi:protein phosphatase